MWTPGTAMCATETMMADRETLLASGESSISVEIAE
jgi:hypothetical protein